MIRQHSFMVRVLNTRNSLPAELHILGPPLIIVKTNKIAEQDFIGNKIYAYKVTTYL